MATTAEMTPASRQTASARATTKTSEENLEAQVSQLQSDIKAIAATLANLSGEKVNEARTIAKDEVRQLKRQGQHVVDDVQDQATAMEKHLKDTIREKPLTSVASAVGIGFILALLTRH